MLPMTKNGTEHVIPLSRQAISLTTIPAAHQHGSGGAGHRISHRQGFERLGRRDGARSGRIRHRQLASPRSATHSGDNDGLAGQADPGHHRSRARSSDDSFASGRSCLQQGAVLPEVATALQLVAEFYRWGRSSALPRVVPLGGLSDDRPPQRLDARTSIVPAARSLGASEGTAVLIQSDPGGLLPNA